MKINSTAPVHWTENIGKWRRQFAWLPVRVAHDEVRWLEFVELRLVKDEHGAFWWYCRPRGSKAEGFRMQPVYD